MMGNERVYILADASYGAGIAGLVASRIVEEYYRPTLVIALEDERSKGSARSVQGFHITKALDECQALLERHGGHSAAAGFTIRNTNIDAFRQKMQAIAASQLTDNDLVSPLRIDAALPLNQANGGTLSQLEVLQPFGIGNPRPTFASYGVQVRDCRSIGQEGAHLKFKLSDGAAVWDAVAFRQSARPDQVPRRIDLAYSLQSRVWNDREQLELVVEDWCSTQG
jgi:single-stranded-DNA-specific exonuclease